MMHMLGYAVNANPETTATENVILTREFVIEGTRLTTLKNCYRNVQRCIIQ